MNFLSNLWGGMTGSWQWIVAIVVLLLILALGLYIEELRIGEKQAQIGTLTQENKQSLDAANHDKEQLERQLKDSKRQADLLAADAARARLEAGQAAQRYEQIMEAKNVKGNDGPVAPILLDSLKRVRQ